ncbi:hypothetical protein C7212DRAFT_29230, partial [Tuber magnatum]
DQEVYSYTPSYCQTREIANHMLSVAGDTKLLRKRWILTIMQYNYHIIRIMGKLIQFAHIHDILKHYIRGFYEWFD